MSVQSPQFPGLNTSRHTAKREAGSIRLLPSKKTPHTIRILCFAFPHLSHTSVMLEKRKNGALSYLFNCHGAIAHWGLLMHPLLPLCMDLPVLFRFLVYFVSFCSEMALPMNLWVLTFLMGYDRFLQGGLMVWAEIYGCWDFVGFARFFSATVVIHAPPLIMCDNVLFPTCSPALDVIRFFYVANLMGRWNCHLKIHDQKHKIKGARFCIPETSML